MRYDCFVFDLLLQEVKSALTRVTSFVVMCVLSACVMREANLCFLLLSDDIIINGAAVQAIAYR